jgi:hypothetical protein
MKTFDGVTLQAHVAAAAVGQHWRCCYDTFGHLLTFQDTRRTHRRPARRRPATGAFYKSADGKFIASQITRAPCEPLHSALPTSRLSRMTMKSVNELLKLFMRQAELERAMRQPGGARVTEEQELRAVRLRLAEFPEDMRRGHSHD